MTTLLNEIKKHQSKTVTENGAATFNTTLNFNLDFFALGAALRTRADEEVISLFSKAFHEDKSIALKTLFYIRDVREGQGERKTFRTCLNWLAKTHPAIVSANMSNIVHYGRWDDLFSLNGTPVWSDVLALIKNRLKRDLEIVVETLPTENKYLCESIIRKL